MIRATAADGEIRAFAATTREMVEEARRCHNTSPVMTAALGRLLTGAVMMGTMMKGEKDLLTLQILGDGPARGLIATADSLGHARGYAYEPMVIVPANDKGKLDVSGAIGAGTLTVIRDLGLREPYTGSCELVSGEIAEDLAYYFAVSEQVPSGVGLGVLMSKDNTVRQAGGFMIQLMPGVPSEQVDLLEQRLAKVRPVTQMLDDGMTPEQILEELLGSMDLQIHERVELGYRCDCSRERVERVLLSLPDSDLDELASSDEEIEVNCQFCGKHYVFRPEEIRQIRRHQEPPAGGQDE